MERDCRRRQSRGEFHQQLGAATDRSAGLTNYPTDLLNSPPQDLSAAIQFRYPIAPAGLRESSRKDTAGPSTALRSGRDDNSVAGIMFS